MERGYPQNFINNTLSEVKFQEKTQALLQWNITKKRILPFVTQHNPAVPNLKEILTSEVVPDRATTIVKPNFQGAAYNNIQKGAFTQRHTRKIKIISKARKPNHVFRSSVGLSTHINTLIS